MWERQTKDEDSENKTNKHQQAEKRLPWQQEWTSELRCEQVNNAKNYLSKAIKLPYYIN